MSHRAKAKRGNLIVGAIGHNVGKSCGLVGNNAREIQVYADFFQPVAVWLEIASGGREHRGLFSQESEAVSDIARSAAEMFNEIFGDKTQVYCMDFIRHNMVAEAAWIFHDFVVGQ